MKVSAVELAGLLCLRLAVQSGLWISWDVLSHWVRCELQPPHGIVRCDWRERFKMGPDGT